MPSKASLAKNVTTFALAVLQVAAAVGILYLILSKLYKANVDAQSRSVNVQCGLDVKGETEDSLCKTGIIGVAVTGAVLFATAMLLVSLHPWPSLSVAVFT